MHTSMWLAHLNPLRRRGFRARPAPFSTGWQSPVKADTKRSPGGACAEHYQVSPRRPSVPNGMARLRNGTAKRDNG